MAGAACGGGGIAGFGGGGGAAGRGGGGAAGRGAAAAGGATGGRGGAGVGGVVTFASAFGFGAAFFLATVLRLAGLARPFAALLFAARVVARAAAPRFTFFAGAFAFLRPFDFDFALRAIKPPLLRG
ncbi:MAG TPA: hypothetical protein VLX85_15625 [Stellaceae bacterium]|nr:hypothetical protein [Stellaceae bacterium]